jgi:hypothetical protein
MPSLSTRRRRAGAGADASAGDLLEGGGSRGTAVTDTTTAATVERLRAFQAQNQAASVASTRAHLVAFPIFLFGVLALCSHQLHLSFASCVIVPILMGGALVLLNLLATKALGEKRSNELVEQHGAPLLMLLLLLTLLGLAVSQMFFRDKLGKPLL